MDGLIVEKTRYRPHRSRYYSFVEPGGDFSRERRAFKNIILLSTFWKKGLRAKKFLFSKRALLAWAHACIRIINTEVSSHFLPGASSFVNSKPLFLHFQRILKIGSCRVQKLAWQQRGSYENFEFSSSSLRNPKRKKTHVASAFTRSTR